MAHANSYHIPCHGCPYLVPFIVEEPMVVHRQKVAPPSTTNVWKPHIRVRRSTSMPLTILSNKMKLTFQRRPSVTKLPKDEEIVPPRPQGVSLLELKDLEGQKSRPHEFMYTSTGPPQSSKQQKYDRKRISVRKMICVKRSSWWMVKQLTSYDSLWPQILL